VTVALCEHKAPASLLLSSGLEIERTDIVFANIAVGRVGIEITVDNRGEMPAPPTLVRIEAAPLGAFLRTRPLARMMTPLLLPGESRTLRLEARTRKPAPLGRADRVPPSRVLTALAGDDERDPPRAGQIGTLPTDLLELFRQGGVHWAGNLNIFFAGKEVERHLAQALRIYPGRTNVAMFMVGQRDTYAFSLHGPNWQAALFDGSRGFMRKEAEITQDEWIRIDSGMVFLALCPPADATIGEIEVHVEQQSTGKKAIVEFSLDAHAAGPGCFVVP
jgi:hypothetical protein